MTQKKRLPLLGSRFFIDCYFCLAVSSSCKWAGVSTSTCLVKDKQSDRHKLSTLTTDIKQLTQHCKK